MLTQPNLESLLEKVDSKFSLISMVSKRVRQLNIGWEALVDTKSMKPVTIALEEIVEGKIYAKDTQNMEEE